MNRKTRRARSGNGRTWRLQWAPAPKVPNGPDLRDKVVVTFDGDKSGAWILARRADLADPERLRVLEKRLRNERRRRLEKAA